AFRIVNVFAEERLSGNPLAIFEDGRGLSDATMQALALQFNLSETTFVLPSESANARVRIFTPTFEMPFAGHPTLGTAHVVRALGAGEDSLRLEMRAGVIPVSATRAMAYVWAATAPGAAVVRFFFPKHGALVEDPGTGSACANLGGWLVATGAALPQRWTLSQGDAVGRRCRLDLTVDARGRIFVTGRVIELGHGTISL